jgi:hypothetical protein
MVVGKNGAGLTGILALIIEYVYHLLTYR